jgi:hypothetical protein
MAQTIATQRGTGSGSQSGSATLFTQSGGNATRVIFNQFAAYAANSNYTNSVTFTMNHVVSNGSTNIIGWFKMGGVASSSFQLFPNPNSTGPIEAVPVINSNGSIYSTNVNGGISGVIGNYPGSSNNVNIGVPATTIGYPTFSSYAPQNFWIGPDDSVVIRWSYGSYYDSSQPQWYYPNITYAYHFTTITES